MDLGAHIGVFTILIINNMDDGLVLAVEPIIYNYILAVNNILNNAIKRNIKVKVVQKAIDIADGVIKTLDWAGFRNYAESISMNTLINIFEQKGYGGEYIDLLKMDIEGAEYYLLTHDNQWLKRVKIIVGELHPYVYGKTGLIKIYESLKSNGFRCFIVERRVPNLHYALSIVKNSNPYMVLFGVWRSLTALFIPYVSLNYLYCVNLKMD